MAHTTSAANGANQATTPMPANRLSGAVGKSCFVIMPFGEKVHPVTKKPIDFDAVYHTFIKPAAMQEGVECLRSDEENKTGLIHSAMIEHILDSTVAIVDITTGNPNVMYELGVRHTARRWGTIIIRQKGHDTIPFNINGLRALDYDLSSEETLEESKKHLAANIKACIVERNIDSLVHTLFNGLNVSRRAKPNRERKVFVWHSPKTPTPKTQFCIITGSIQNVDTVDLWVNPENTKMQLGRYHDDSISSYIRYWGARRNANGAVIRDIVNEKLQRKIRSGFQVEPGTVVLTHSCRLKQQNKVQAILHVAAQHGEPGKGYTTIRSHMECVSNALDRADEYNTSWLCWSGARRVAKSILFPLFGTRGSGDDPQSVTIDIVQAAKVYFENWPETKIERVYFLAYTDYDEELCVTAFQKLNLNYGWCEPEEGPPLQPDKESQRIQSVSSPLRNGAQPHATTQAV